MGYREEEFVEGGRPAATPTLTLLAHEHLKVATAKLPESPSASIEMGLCLMGLGNTQVFLNSKNLKLDTRCLKLDTQCLTGLGDTCPMGRRIHVV